MQHEYRPNLQFQGHASSSQLVTYLGTCYLFLPHYYYQPHKSQPLILCLPPARHSAIFPPCCLNSAAAAFASHAVLKPAPRHLRPLLPPLRSPLLDVCYHSLALIIACGPFFPPPPFQARTSLSLSLPLSRRLVPQNPTAHAQPTDPPFSALFALCHDHLHLGNLHCTLAISIRLLA